MEPRVKPCSSFLILIKTLLLLTITVFSSPWAYAENCTGTYTYVHTGTGGSNYTINSGEKLKIASGTYTAAVNNFSSNSQICVESGAIFTPQNMNNVQGTLLNYGTANLQTFSYNAGTVIENYGTLNFTAGLNTNGATSFLNHTNATMTMASSFQLGNNSTFTNDGLITAQQDFNTQSGTTLTNNYRLELNGNFNPDGTFNNYGRVYAKKFMNINSNSTVTNYCALVSYEGFNNNSPKMVNEGTILITTATGSPGGPWQNNQAFKNGSSAKIAGGNFINNSAITGGGSMIFSGETRNQGAFTGNSPTVPINFYDETQTGSQYFDYQTVTPANTVRTVFTRPTELDAPETCSTSYKAFTTPAASTAICNGEVNLGYGLSETSGTNAYTGVFPTIHSGSVVGSDGSPSLLVGGNFTVAAGAEIEGKVVVLGNMLVQADSGLYDLGLAGLGSQVIPASGSDALLVKGNLTVNDEFNVGYNTTYNVRVGGTLGGSSVLHANGTVTSNDSSLNLNAYLSNFSDLQTKSSYWKSLTPTGTVTVDSSNVVFAGNGAGGIQVFEISAGQLNLSYGHPLRFTNLLNDGSTNGASEGVTVIVNVLADGTGTAYLSNLADMIAPDGSNNYNFNPTLAGNILWNIPDATTINIGGAGSGQFWGSLVAPKTGNTVYMQAPGLNGRVIVAGNLVQDKAYSEFHNYEFDPSYDLAIPSCSLTTVSGTVYTDTNGSNSFDSGTESGIGSITVTLMNDANSAVIATTNTANDGTYSFAGISSSLTYRIQVDTSDTDLPTGTNIGTTNPLTAVTVTAGSTTANQNFGFDPASVGSCPSGAAPIAKSGYASSITASTATTSPANALGAPEVAGTVPSYSNAALIDTNGSLTLNLGAIIPGATTLEVSLVRNSNSSRVRIATSLDGITYTTLGTYGKSADWGSSVLASLERLKVTIPGNGARYIRFVREAGSIWVDAVSYTETCHFTSLDFGDAAATYGDASHAIVSGIHLGDNAPDAETSSDYSFNARADANDDGAPSQPVSTYIPLFPVLKMTDTTYSTNIQVTNTTGTAGKLYGWIDFDHSGTFDSDEATVASVASNISDTSLVLSWNSIPADIKLGTTIIRLRLSTDISLGANTPGGFASDGEVEDYPIAVAIDIPPNSPAISIVSGATPAACEIVVFEDDFNDLSSDMFWGANRPGSQGIRNWTTAGGGVETYARTVDNSSLGYGTSIYFGNGAVRRVSPAIGTGLSFDTNGKLLTNIDAIELRDVDDISYGTQDSGYSATSDWGPQPVTLSRTFDTEVGKPYRLYFKAIPEDMGSNDFPHDGAMRLDLPGGSIHFRIPNSNGAVESYAVEFTAISTTSTVTFVNYGHFNSGNEGWCDPNSVVDNNPWCTADGGLDGKNANELIIDDVVLTEAICPTVFSGTVYLDTNGDDQLDTTSESGFENISVNVYDTNFTPYDLSDDTLVKTVSTDANGAYSIRALQQPAYYRVEVNGTDTDLPEGAIIGTENPLLFMVLTEDVGKVYSDVNFGFDIPARYTISGKVFEDIGYGGGPGRPVSTPGIAVAKNVTVELYDADGNLFGTTVTNSNGVYSFIDAIDGDYYVRIVTDTVNSFRSGSDGSELAVQTYRTDGITPVTNETGGRNPSATDAPANASKQKLDVSTFKFTDGTQAQSVQFIRLNEAHHLNVDFGFNFSTIVNANDKGQGSLRQFILNSNLLAQTGLNQELPAALEAVYTTGTEVSIFMIPQTQMTNGVATLAIQTALPTGSKGNVSFDARTQTLNIGDTNAGTVGQSTTVGVDKLAIEPIELPEVALDCSALPDNTGAEYCFSIGGTNSQVHGFAFYGAATGNLDDPSAALHVQSTATATISANLFGTLPDGSEPVWEKQNWRIGLLVEGVSSVTGNYFAYNGYGAMFNRTTTAVSTFTANQMELNGPNVDQGALNGSEDGDGLAIWGRAEVVIEGNHIQNSRVKDESSGGNGGGNGNIDHGNLIEVTNAGSALITNNTLINGLVANIGVYNASSNVRIEYNILTAARGTGRSPTGSGVLVNPLGQDPDPVIITRNSIFANNGLGIDLDPGNQSQTGNRVTKNDSHDSDSGPNDLLNFPFFTEAYLVGGNLVISGCSPKNADIEIFEADVSPGGTDAPGINKFGNAKDYGEGQIYLTTVQEGSAGDTDATQCAHLSDADGNNNRGMQAFHFILPIPDGIEPGDMLTATATLADVGTSEFSLVSDGVVHVTYDISGTVFEDINYGGGTGRPFETAGTAGLNDVVVELYDALTGEKVSSTRTENNGTHDGYYAFPDAEVGTYYVRVVNESISSSRANADGSERAVQTFRTDGAIATNNEVGGRHPAQTDGPAQQGSSLLDVDTFKFTRGPLNGDYAQSLQYIDLSSLDIEGVDFGFSFNTVVNTEPDGQGSLHQAILNANLLGDDTNLAQTGRVANMENIIFHLPTSDSNHITQDGVTYWSIKNSELPDITSPLVIDGATQTGFTSAPIVELNGTASSNGTNGLQLVMGSDGSRIRNLGINSFPGNGIHILNSANHQIERNYIGISLVNKGDKGNTSAGILLENASNNMIGSTTTGNGNTIGHNNGAGISVTGTSSKDALLGNSIFSNSGLGIDLGGNGVTPNDEGDSDTGPNELLNFPDTQVNSFSVNGSKILAYDFDLDVPATTYGYRMEFFKNLQKDNSGYGEGRIYLGYKDITHPGIGLINFKGTLNVSQTLESDDLITATLTEKTSTSTFGSTSEFSGTQSGTRSTVCTSLISNPGDAVASMVIDENITDISLLEAKDSSGNPITYVISGGADGGYFAVTAPATGATIDCSTIKFINSSTVIIKSASVDDGNTESQTRTIVPPGYLPPPGDFENPVDSDKGNTYDLQITAITADGKQYVRNLDVRVMNVNEAPYITSQATAALREDAIVQALDIASHDPDGTLEGRGLSYSITGGVDSNYFTVSATSGILKFRAIPDYDSPIDANGDNIYEVEVTVTDDGGLSGSQAIEVTVVNDEADDGVMLTARAFLQGAYDLSTGLMSGDLEPLGLLPLNQPYTNAPFNYAGTETLNSLLQEMEGNNAIVDWVLLELRSDLQTVVARRALILQRDGDLVDAQSGATALHFASVPAGSYYVSLRHRNHLDVITATPVSLDHDIKMVDFTQLTTLTNGEHSRMETESIALMWAGDVNFSDTLSASGPGNDITTLLSTVITAKSNRYANTNFITQGYLTSDLNLDGKTLFTGPDNDASLLAGNIILHPLNTDFAANYIVKGGLAP